MKNDHLCADGVKVVWMTEVNKCRVIVVSDDISTQRRPKQRTGELSQSFR